MDPSGLFLLQPLVVQVTGTDSETPSNAPVTFTVTSGGAQLAATTNDLITTNLTLRTDSNGLASVWIYFPTVTNLFENVIFVQAGSTPASTNAYAYLDADGNGLPDFWEIQYFGTNGLDPNSAPDGNGQSLLYDYQNGVDPTDYYDGNTPILQIVSGNNQSGSLGSFLPLPLTVRATDSNSNILTNAPITLMILDGAQLATTTNDMLETSLSLRTDSNGLVSVWANIPMETALQKSVFYVEVSAGSGSKTAQTNFTEFVGSRTPMLAIGGERIMELSTNGDVVSWGGNQYGEFGDYTYLDSTNPVHVVGLANIVKIATGLNHSLAIDAKGTLWAWGQQSGYWNFGDGGNQNSTNLPVQVPGMTNTIAIAAHGNNNGDDGFYGLSLAIEADGTVWMWGDTDGGFWFGPSPVQVIGVSNAVAGAVGAYHALALKKDGIVWAWGGNYSGELGNGTTTDSGIPVQVVGLSNIVAICAGDNHSLALDTNGCVWAWGFDGFGQLGDGQTGAGLYSDVPTMVVGLTNVVAIAAGANHSLAVDGTGKLWAWGNDNAGQLGDGGSTGITNLPMQVLTVTNVISIAAGSDASAAVDGNGNLWQWGAEDNDEENLALGDTNGYPNLASTYVDVYNGRLPNLTILNGNNQAPHTGLEFEQPLIFQVMDTNGMALSNAPVSVEVVAGGMKLRTTSGGTDYTGLRLTTDTNGEVALIGYADWHVYNTDCLVRVLAASRAQVAEVDFNETLVPLPNITIASPVNGGTYLIKTNQPLTITVDAQAGAGASIEEVDYYYQTNGSSNMPLSVSTQSPYSFIWTNSLWWTNAFIGQYTLSAVAVDNSGARSDPQSVTFTIGLDSNGNGMPDYWQLQYFGQLGVDPNTDPDGDDISNLQEYQNGTNPTDYYNGNLPVLEIVGGNDQAGNYDSFLPEPVIIEVKNVYSVALTNAPLTFTVTNGTALLAVTTNDTPVTSLALRTDTNGQVSAWVYFPPASSNPPDSTILVNAASGTNSVVTPVNEFIPLAHWTFNDTNTWVGEGDQLPLLAANVAGVPSWSSNALLVDSSSPALLAYNVVETNGNTNITCQAGSLLFWFKPDWSSADAGGNGPGTWGRLIEMGNYDPAFINGWWALYLNPAGTQLLFGTSTNGLGMTNLVGNISWLSNQWHQIALTYSPTGSALYVDGQILNHGYIQGQPACYGNGVACFPNADELTNGFRIGSDQDGNNQAGGAFDELETFNYPLDAANTYTHGSDIPDWWEVKYFNRTGMNPNSATRTIMFSGTLLDAYQYGLDPNVIQFTLSLTNQYVNNSTVSVPISIQTGTPFFMAVLVDTNSSTTNSNGTIANFTAAIWQPYPSNAVSLSSGDGSYSVWIGLRGLPPDAQQTWQVTRLVLDTVPPVLTITNPAAVVSQPMIQLQGYANETLGSLSFDVSNATGIWTNQTGYITGQFCDTNLLAITTNYFQCYDIVLTTNGVNLITLHATDLAGNTATTNVSVTLDYSGDATPPVLAVIWPQDGTLVSGSQFTFEGQVDDPTATIMASIVDAGGNTNTVQALVERSGLVWVQNLPLADGENTLTITATDAAGNTSVTNLTLVRSAVTVTLDPIPSDQLNQSSVSVSGTVSDASCTITVNGVSATVNTDGTWEADNVPVSPGGTAIFDVEVYSSEQAGMARVTANARSAKLAGAGARANDATSTASAGSQLPIQPEPAKVVLKSYTCDYASYHGYPGKWGLIGWYSGWDPYTGPPLTLGNSYEMGSRKARWTYESGGFDKGYGYFNGELNEAIVTAWPEYSSWNEILQGGENGFNPELEYNPADGIQTHVMIKPSGLADPGTKVTYIVRAQAWFLGTGLTLVDWVSPESLQIGGVTLTDDGSGWGEMLLQAEAGEWPEVTPTAPVANYYFNIQATELDLQLAVDNNRDGNITFDQPGQTNPDKTSAAKPFRFWINDSQESGDISSGANDVPSSSSPNYNLNHVNGRSDLINFFPVALSLSNVLQLLPPSSGYEYHLVQNDSAVKFVYTPLSSTNAFDYLTNIASIDYGTNFDEVAINADTLPVSVAPGAVLDTNWLAHVQNNGGQGVILVEGCAATTQPLWLEIWHKNQSGNNKLLCGVPLYLSINSVEQMYRWINLRDSFTVSGGTQPTINYPTRLGVPPNFPDNGSNGRQVIYVHGFNVRENESRAEIAEAFKRLWQSGSKAMFTGVSWYGDQGYSGVILGIIVSGGTSLDYYSNVRNAFLTAPALASAVANLPGVHKVVIAHSLGNMVVSSAIVDCGMNVEKYFAIDAAVAMEAYDGSIRDLDMVNPNVKGTFQGWPNYDQRLWPTEWYQLFSPANGFANDGRYHLTWRDRFGAIPNLYNFYSSGEDVLENIAQPQQLPALGHEWIWVSQEMRKGTGLLGVLRFLTLVDAFPEAGWALNSDWDILQPDGNTEPRHPNQAILSDFTDNSHINTNDLQTNPFFMPFNDGNLIISGLGSAEAANVQVRAEVLGRGIPALSLATGANSAGVFDNNFDMNSTDPNFGFQTYWPLERISGEWGTRWRHSDLKDVAYPFNHKLHDKLVQLGGLNNDN
jgi:alpha-tubulin suppressor-like RCC1 family protein